MASHAMPLFIGKNKGKMEMSGHIDYYLISKTRIQKGVFSFSND